MSRLASSKTARIWAERIALCERSNAPVALPYPGRRFALPWAISFCPFGAGTSQPYRVGSYWFEPIVPTREQNSGTVPEFFLFAIGGSAPGASWLVLGLGELCAFAVNLGSLSIARFEQNSGTVPEFFHRAVGEGNAVGLPSSTADSAAESNVLCEPAPTLHLLLESRRDPPVVALRLPPANGFDPSGIRCPGRPIRLVFFTKLGDSPRVFSISNRRICTK